MALQNQFIPLGVGMETDVAAQLVQPGSVLLAENSVTNERGQRVRRPGARSLAASGGQKPAWRLATLGGGLVRFNEAPEPVKIYDPVGGAFVADGLGDIPAVTSYRKGPTSVETMPVVDELPAGEAVSSPSVAVGHGYAVVCYERATFASAWSEHVILELASGRIVYRRRLAAVTKRPRPLVVGTHCVVAYEIAGTLQLDVYDLTTLSISGSQAAGLCTAGTQISIRPGALTVGANRFSVLYQEDTSGYLTVADADITNVAAVVTYQAKTAVGGLVVPDRGLAWMQDIGASGKFSPIVADSVAGLRVLWALGTPSGGHADATATHVLDASATAAPSGSTPGIRNIIGATVGSSPTGAYRVNYEVTAPDLPTQGSIKAAVWSGSATLATLYRGVGIRSTFWANDTSLYFWAAWAGREQQTYFALAQSKDLTPSADTFPAPQAVAFPRAAAGLTEKLGNPTDIAIGAGGEIFAAVTTVTRVESVVSAGTATGIVDPIFAIDLIELTHRTAGDTSLGRPVEFLGHLFTPGGALGAFDGHTYALAGFPCYPPSVGTQSRTGGNLTPSSRYYYRACYAFVDANGRKWRSAPSTPIPADTTGSDFQFDVAIETLRLVDRGVSDIGGYQIELYRSDPGESAAFFLVASVTNDSTATSVTIRDNVGDTALGEELYTDGGGMENQLLPAASHAVLFQKRLFTAVGGTLWYSLDADLTHGLLFNETMTLDVGDPTDPVTALAATDAYLVALKGERVYVITGQGANSLGQGATYEDRLVEAGVGTTNAASVTVAQDGTIWFKSTSERAGFHRVNGLSVEYVGNGVRAFDGLTVTSSVVVAARSELRFYTLEGRTLVFNWITSAWSTNTVQPCYSAVSGYAGAAGAVYENVSSGAILADDLNALDEAGVDYDHVIESPWLAIASMQGWERIGLVQGVGTDNHAHNLEMTLLRDYDDSDTIGTFTKWFSGSGTKWEWSKQPAIQKLTALKVRIKIKAYEPTLTYVPDPNPGDQYTGAGVWHFANGEFDPVMEGGTVVVTGAGALDGTYTITDASDEQNPVFTPAPGGGPTSIVGATVTVTYTATPVRTVGPAISGVTLRVDVKRGTKKLPPSLRSSDS